MLLATVLLLSACAARYDYANGIALRLREIKGDKYTADVWVDVAFENGVVPVHFDAEKVSVNGSVYSFNHSSSLLKLRDGPENVGVLILDDHSLKSLNNKDYTLVIENIDADGAKYPGKWELPFTIKNDNSSVLYTAEPKTPGNEHAVQFDTLELCPQSLHIEAQGTIKSETEPNYLLELVFSSGDRYHGHASSFRTDTDGGTSTIVGTVQFAAQIDNTAAAALIFDGIEYTLTKAKGK